MDDNKFKCCMCEGVFDKAWSDAEAIAEKEERFGAVAIEDCNVVCDDCFKRLGMLTIPDWV